MKRIVESNASGKVDKKIELPRLVIRTYGENANEMSRISAITEVPLGDLISAARFFIAKHWEDVAMKQRLANVEQVAEIAQQVALPNLDDMDRLMRYQTTVSRQLSTAIGELLAITRSR